MTSELRRVLGFIYVHPIVFWGTCKAQGVGLLIIKRTRTGETRQGRLRWFDEAIARFLDGNLNCHFFRGFYGAQAVGASASHDISHMRRRYSALLMVYFLKLEPRENSGELGLHSQFPFSSHLVSA